MSTKSDSGSEDAPAVNGSSGSAGGSSHGERASSLDTYDDDVCRDYMRNVCTRGKRCRYRHPPSDDRSGSGAGDQGAGPPRRDLTFCHDYQNAGCTRSSCKFLHCSRDEQEYFYRTGLLPSRLNHSGPGSVPAIASPTRADVPTCRDYLNGDCKRGSKCKYKHEAEKSLVPYKGSSNNNNHYVEYDRRVNRSNGDYRSDLKRRRIDDDYDDDINGNSRGSYNAALEDENSGLRRKMVELKKQVSDLTAINEVLLEQNARYRMSKVAMAAAALQVSVASGQPQPCVVPAMALAPSHHTVHSSLQQQLNSTLTQQVAINSDLATQHAIAAQRLAAAQQGSTLVAAQPRVAPGPAMTVTPAVTINAQNVGCAQLALTQSNLPVSMATMPQLQVAHSLTQNLGAPSTSLVSYPIMSQNMRSAVEPSSHAH